MFFLNFKNNCELALIIIWYMYTYLSFIAIIVLEVFILKRCLLISIIIIMTFIVGCNSSHNTFSSVPENIIKEKIIDYIATKEFQAKNGGKIFCAYEIIDTKEKNNSIILYLYTTVREYHKDGDTVVMDWGEVLPMIIEIENKDNNLNIIDYKASKSIEFSESIKIFPNNIQKIIKSEPFQVNALENIDKEINKSVKVYFNEN